MGVRTRSKSKTAERETKEPDQKHQLLFRPVHLDHGDSVLTSSNLRALDFHGFVNLGLLLVISFNVRLIIENYLKYGVLFVKRRPFDSVSIEEWVYVGLAYAMIFVNFFIAFAVEKAMVKNGRVFILQWLMIFNICCTILFPTFFTWNYLNHALVGIILLMSSLITCMKLISYHSVNGELRERGGGVEFYKSRGYPLNLSFGDILFFAMVPTLCYQPVYPRTERIVRHRVLKHILEIVACCLMIYFLLEQYVVPTVKNSLRLFDEPNWMGFLERVLKLSISSLYIWLLMFYSFFHSYLNLWGELTCFADRNFYQGWWNANTVEEYWRYRGKN